MKGGVAQSVFWTLLLPLTLHFYLIFYLWGGAPRWPLSPRSLQDMLIQISFTLIFTFPVTLGLLAVCSIFAVLHLITALRIAPSFPSVGHQFLVGVLNPSLAIVAIILAAFVQLIS